MHSAPAAEELTIASHSATVESCYPQMIAWIFYIIGWHQTLTVYYAFTQYSRNGPSCYLHMSSSAKAALSCRTITHGGIRQYRSGHDGKTATTMVVKSDLHSCVCKQPHPAV